MISQFTLNPFLAGLIEQGRISRNIGEALVPHTLFRRDIGSEPFVGKMGDRIMVRRPGLLPVNILPLVPGVDPTPQQYASEVHFVEARPYGNAVDAYLPNDYVAVAKESLEKTRNLAINAGQTLDRLARAALYRSYLAGNTCATVAAGAGANTVHVASINGFTEVNSATTGVPIAVSALNPLGCTFGATPAVARNCIGAVADDPVNAPLGPGWLTFAAVFGGAGILIREAVLANNRSLVIFSGGGNSVDAIGAADTLSMADIVNAVGQLREGPAPVPAFEGGLYHAHLGVSSEGQVIMDPMVRGLIHAVEIPPEYRAFSMGEIGGALFVRNDMVPNWQNSGALVATGLAVGSAVPAQCAPEIGGEVRNGNGVNVTYTLIYGRDHCTEYRVPEGEFQASNAISTQMAVPAVSSSGVDINVSGATFVFRPPIDRLAENNSFAWKMKGDWAVPTDISTQARRYRRGVIICSVRP